MKAHQFSGPTSLTVSVLPARAVYLIRAGSRAGFRRAIQEASTRWGGATEPIIPVRVGGKLDAWWHQVATATTVEAVVNIDISPSDAARVAQDLEIPLVDLKHIDDFGGAASWNVHPSALPTEGTYGSAVAAGRSSALWMAVAAGDVTPEHEAALPGDTIIYHRVDQADQIGRAELRGETLLNRTTGGFREHWQRGGSGQLPAIVWIAKPNAYLDCLWYWNLRALRSLRFSVAPMVLLPEGQVQHWLNFDQQLHEHLARFDQFSPDVIIAGLRSDRPVFDAVAAQLGLTLSDSDIRTGRRWPTPRRAAPFTYLTADEVDPRQWFLADRRYGETRQADCYVHEGTATVRVQSPVSWVRPAGTTLLEFRGAALDQLPKRDRIAEAVLRNAVWRDGALQMRTNTLPEYFLSINIPDLRDALDLVISSKTLKHQLSDKGKLGAALAEHAEVLLEPGVFEAASSLSTPRAKQLEKELRAMRDRGHENAALLEVAAAWGGRTERRSRSVTTLDGLGNLQAVEALERLCAVQWVERGTQVVCGRCGVTSFVSLQATVGNATCPGCESAQAYTTSRQGLEVYYRLNTLADRAVDQGVLPHLLAAAALSTQATSMVTQLGTDVVFPDGDVAEVDLIGLIDGQIFAGEVKTNPMEFTPQQIRRDISCSKRLGADLHIMAAVGEIPDDIRQIASREATASELVLMVLDKHDLRPVAAPSPK